MLHQSLLAQNEYERKIIYDWSNENRAMLFFVLVNTQKVWELFISYVTYLSQTKIFGDFVSSSLCLYINFVYALYTIQILCICITYRYILCLFVYSYIRYIHV